MGINKYKIASQAGEEAATREQLAKALGAEAGSSEFAKAFNNAAGHGLIATEAADKADQAAEWTQTDKGKQKVEAKA